MQTAMENIREMVDVNTIVGDPVETPDGSVILPISKVGFGFAAGGSEFNTEQGSGGSSGKNQQEEATVALPFGGGSGGGVSITPIAFLIVNAHGIKVVPLDNNTHIYERMIDLAPQVMDKIQNMLSKNGQTVGTTQTGASQVTTFV